MPYDYSQLQTFQACPERYHLRFLEQLERITDTPEDQPRRFGQALHTGLAAWYRGLGAQAMSDCFLALFPKPLIEGEKLYLPQNGLKVLQEYLTQYGVADKQYKTLAVETAITIALSTATPYLVKLDTVLEDANGIWVLEHKSTASPKAFTNKWWEQFEPNSQLSGQVMACQQQFGRCDGIILNGISFRFGVRMGFQVEFQRQIFSRTEEQLADWQQNIERVIQRMEHTKLIDRGIPFEKNESQCAWCEFRPLCLSCGSQGVREAMYQVNPNPLIYQREG